MGLSGAGVGDLLEDLLAPTVVVPGDVGCLPEAQVRPKKRSRNSPRGRSPGVTPRLTTLVTAAPPVGIYPFAGWWSDSSTLTLV